MCSDDSHGNAFDRSGAMVRVLVSSRWDKLGLLKMMVKIVLMLVILRYGSADMVMAGQGRTVVAIHSVLLLMFDSATSTQNGTGPVVVLE